MTLEMTFIRGNDLCDKTRLEKYYAGKDHVFPCYNGTDEIFFIPDGRVFCTMNKKDSDSAYFYYGEYKSNADKITCYFNHQYAYYHAYQDLPATSAIDTSRIDISYSGKSTGIKPFTIDIYPLKCPDFIPETDTLKLLLEAMENNYPEEFLAAYDYYMKLPSGENFLLSKIEGKEYWNNILTEAGLIKKNN